MLSSLRTSSRARPRSASELDSVMEFGLSGAIQLASKSATSSRAGRRPGFQLVADGFELSRDSYVEIARTWSQTSRFAARELVCDLLARW